MAFSCEKNIIEINSSKAVILPKFQSQELNSIGIIVFNMDDKNDRKNFFELKEELLVRLEDENGV